MEKDQLKKEFKEHMISYLNLTDLSPEEIDDNEPLFVEGLGLDSIDAIELIVLIEREYGIKIKDSKKGKNILTNVDSIADYLLEHATKGIK